MSSYPKRVEDIDRHITNVVSISVRFGGKAAFFTMPTAGTAFFRNNKSIKWGETF